MFGIKAREVKQIAEINTHNTHKHDWTFYFETTKDKSCWRPGQDLKVCARLQAN